MSTETPVQEIDLICPLCEYNLRGLEEPRCPECGHRSTWEELRQQQPNHPYLFERHPERNAWSFFRTLFASLRPRKFWRELSPTVLPVPKRLLIYCSIIIALGVLGTLTGLAVDAAQYATYSSQARTRWVNDITLRSNAETAEIVASFKSRGLTLQQVAHQTFPGPGDAAFWRSFLHGGLRSSDFLDTGFLIGLWPLFTFAALMIFRASLRQAKIKNIHVARCVVYTGSVLAVISALYIVIIPLVYVFPALGYRQLYFGDWAAYGMAGVILILCYRLGVAYSKYLRFDKPYLTALASQIIVMLALWKVALMMHGW